MASVANLPTQIRYYCHQCECGITPNLEDFTCPNCNGGFVEELRGNEGHLRGSSNNTGGPPRNADEMENFFENLLMRSIGVEPIEMESELVSTDSSSEMEYEGVITRSRRNRGRAGRGGSRTRTTVVTPQRRIIQHTIPMSLFSQFPAVGGGNQDMFELLITHLMNAAPSGPPPASQEEIGRLRRVKLSAAEVAEHEKCSVCFDDYSVDDNCIQLTCQHVFHEACISTWLKRHGTCPVCRKDLNGRMTQYDAQSPGGGGGGPSRTIFFSSAGGAGLPGEALF